MVDMSDRTGHPADKLDAEGFHNWTEDAGMACWGKDSHIYPDLCSEDLIEISNEQWSSSFSSVFLWPIRPLMVLWRVQLQHEMQQNLIR